MAEVRYRIATWSLFNHASIQRITNRPVRAAVRELCTRWSSTLHEQIGERDRWVEARRA